MKACALMLSGDLIYTSPIELSRFMVALKYLNSTLTSDEVWYLVNESTCGTVEEDEE